MEPTGPQPKPSLQTLCCGSEDGPSLIKDNLDQRTIRGNTYSDELKFLWTAAVSVNC